MTTLLVSTSFASEFGAELDAFAKVHALPLELVVLPSDVDARVTPEDTARVTAALFSGDIHPERSRSFYSTLRKAQHLQWLHVFNAGVDAPIFTELMQRSVRLSTSSGSNAEAVANSALAGLLALSRGLPRWIAQQREREWRKTPRAEARPDLRGQTLLLIGAGAIGGHIATVARALGLQVVVVRLRPGAPGDDAHETHPPSRLNALLPRADWLIIACPLTPETRGLIDAAALARLPTGAHVVNIGRGEIIDQPALIAALERGDVAGAYLDVFDPEPLPLDSLLWSLPNVIVSPHDAATAAGNDRRVFEMFCANLARWHAREPLLNEVTTQAAR
ncbi:MAG: D-2-hydroxyacid dehydrogenase [Proteobacteria bacterium]|nr:D-2-hydroxyacid dehydrogenase [Burkholderiales bacterium]